MSRKELIKKLKEKNSKLSQVNLENVIDSFSECILSSLRKGNAVELRNFGRFSIKKLKENFNARNPSTNELIYKPERAKIRFRPSKKLKKVINE